ncbi:hypothetical protein [Leptospirillum ferriphilum]|jgi:hypothetical protein|uniref:hypothetical protein n=2 Tax=Leptospirillum ferriphilum TaxID=178606 RepID=UPI0006B16853|nr:hypothetical protein [Leptospirillum ferriphilum]OOH82454.1 hypothetical protein BOX30_03095 [Leptospirillum ferriphilum]
MDRGIIVSRKEVESTTLSETLDRYEKEISSSKKDHQRENNPDFHLEESSLGKKGKHSWKRYGRLSGRTHKGQLFRKHDPPGIGNHFPPVRNGPEGMGDGRPHESRQGNPDALPSTAISIFKDRPGTRRFDGKVRDIGPDAISRDFAKACRNAGISGLHFHNLRHEATSQFFEKDLKFDAGGVHYRP